MEKMNYENKEGAVGSAIYSSAADADAVTAGKGIANNTIWLASVNPIIVSAPIVSVGAILGIICELFFLVHGIKYR